MSHTENTDRLVDHLFRHEAGRIVSTLTRIFGIDRMEIAEDVVQEALLKALQQWPYSGVPENPAGWIMQVARRQALDILRREQNLKSKEVEILADIGPQTTDQNELFLDDDIRDDELRMMFVCCHPSLGVESQIALTLKTLCGFGVDEIARAFLCSRETIHKRLVRARQHLREGVARFEIPANNTNRLETVLQVLYLLFNEGYNASHGEELIRRDLGEEAIRLTRLLAQHRVGNDPKTHALLALMLLHTARFPGRVDNGGNLLLLREQDRSVWNKAMILEGLQELDHSAIGDEISEYHLQAGIAACHCLAESYESTDWKRILMLYDMLVEINDSPVVSLNRAIAVSKVSGAEAGIQTIQEIRNRKQLDRYYLLYAVLGEFQMTLGNFEEAAKSYRKALELTQLKSEQVFLMGKLEAVSQNVN